MTSLAYFALFGWIPLCLVFYRALPPRRAMLTSLLGGYLLLPMAKVDISGFPDFSKLTAVAVGALAGSVIYDSGRMLAVRWRWFDGFVGAFCVWPLVSALANGIAAYEGLSEVAQQVVNYGIPYLLGRMYFTDRAALRDILEVTCTAAVLYLPLVWYEMRMSPNLHHDLYGYQQHSFLQTWRQGGWRPQVFLQHGLALAQFLAGATISAFCLWLSRTRRRVVGLSMGATTLLLLATTVMCRSAGALALLLAGLGLLTATRRGQRRWPVFVLLLVAPMIMAGRLGSVLETQSVTEAASRVFDANRVQSLRFRLENEDILIGRAQEKFLWGWGPAGRFRTDLDGKDVVGAADGLWSILLGQYGLVGLLFFVASLLVPALAGLHVGRLVPPAAGSGPVTACLGILVGLHLIDFIFNAMLSPLAIVTAGALAGVSTAPGLTRVPR